MNPSYVKIMSDPVTIHYRRGIAVRRTSVAKPKKKAKASKTPKVMWVVKGYSKWDGSYYSIYDSQEGAQRDANTGDEIYSVEPQYVGKVRLELDTKK